MIKQEIKGDKTMKSIIMKRYADKIEDAMVQRYRDVIAANGSIQYKIYIWDDGEIECLEQPQGDSGYLKANELESRALYYVTTIDAPCFDPWDCVDHSAPEDEQEREEELREILEWLSDEYEQNVHDALMDLIVEAEQEEEFSLRG